MLGRERGDILFPEDGYVSGTHARIALNDGQVFLSDLGSSNGTFLRVRHERTVPTGSFVLMGQQLFRRRAHAEPKLSVRLGDHRRRVDSDGGGRGPRRPPAT